MFNKTTIKKLKGLIALTRWTEVYDYTIALTLLAAVFAGTEWQWRIICILFTNLLGQFFVMMVNDTEDAEDDATNPKKKKRNPISNGSLTKKEGYIAFSVMALLFLGSLVLIGFRDNLPLLIVIAITTLIVQFLYSWKPVRLKSMPVLDILSHVYMMAGGPFLLAYLCFKPVMDGTGWLGLTIVLFISSYGQIENQIRDYETDRQTNIGNSASYVGLKWAKVLQVLVLIISVILILAYIYTMPQRLLFLAQLALVFAVASIYPVVKYFITKDLKRLQLDMHRVTMLVGYLVLLMKILHII